MEIIKAVRVGVLGLKVRSQQIFGMAVSFSQKYDSDDDDENDNAGEDEADERKMKVGDDDGFLLMKVIQS